MTQNNPIVQGFFDPATATISYVVHEAESSKAAIIDPVLDYDPRTARTSTRSATLLLDYVRQHELQVDSILETHAHADHLSAAQELRRELGAGVAIGERICEVQAHFAHFFEIETEVTADGRQFDRLFRDGDTFTIGTLQGRVMSTPGHTPACVTYVIGDAAFVGDTLFMPDFGTARTDFPGGDARTLYRSIQRILQLPPTTRLFTCHDYQPGGREPRWETTVGAQRRDNLMVRDGISEDAFVRMRTARDAGLQAPALILPSLQVNIRGGRLPPLSANGVRYLKLPLNRLGRSEVS
jgi:glyoxylase-like metal-dependent hydrolase (beta-lactamase superfamily II)